MRKIALAASALFAAAAAPAHAGAYVEIPAQGIRYFVPDAAFAGTFGPATYNVTGGVTAVMATDLNQQGAFGLTVGCTSSEFGGSVAGTIALVARGGCFFVDKVKYAQDAGAIGVVILNNGGSTFTSMGGTDPGIFVPSAILFTDTSTFYSAASEGGLTVRLFNDGVPEPASWALMILGMGLVGGSLRQRRKLSVTFA